jgi:hypothetical protein
MRALIFMLVLEGGRNRFLFSFHYSQSVVSPVDSLGGEIVIG